MATTPVPLDHLAPDARYERFGNNIVPHTTAGPPPERLVQFGGVSAVQPDQLLGYNDGVAVDDLGGAGEGIGSPLPV